ncbi:MAG: hypothetical protein IPP40_13580 [bacterium]|nr:hypothetical protein [bacterium]
MRKTDAVILLCELPTDDLDSLVKDYPDIDVVISTGALRSGETTTTIGKKTRLLGTGSSGYNGHYATLEFKPTWGDSIGFADFKDALIETYDVTGAWTEKLAAFEQKTGVPQPMQPAKTGMNITPGVGTSPTVSPSATPSNQATPSTQPGHEGHNHG